MSWFSGLSNITGNISTFTKDLLTEGTEEVEDVESHLNLANAKIRELEGVLNTLYHEIDQLKHSNEELHLQTQASQQQLDQTHENYRQQILEKDEEIRNTRLKLEQESWQQFDSTDWSVNPPLSLDASHLDFASEEQPFSEINLHEEVGKKIAHNKKKSFETPSAVDSEKLLKEMTSLRVEKEDLVKQLELLEELRQNELFALQESYEKKILVINANSESRLEKLRLEYEEKIVDLNQKLAELTSQKESSNGASDGWDNCGDLAEDEAAFTLAHSQGNQGRNDSPTILEVSTSSTKTDAHTVEVDELKKKVLQLTGESRMLNYDCMVLKDKKRELKSRNKKLSREVDLLALKNDNLQKEPVLYLFNSLNSPQLQKLFLETLAVCQVLEDDELSITCLQRCQQQLAAEYTKTSSYKELVSENFAEKASSSTIAAALQPYYEEPCRTISPTLAPIKASTDQLEQYLQRLTEQIHRYNSEVARFKSIQQPCGDTSDAVCAASNDIVGVEDSGDKSAAVDSANVTNDNNLYPIRQEIHSLNDTIQSTLERIKDELIEYEEAHLPDSFSKTRSVSSRSDVCNVSINYSTDTSCSPVLAELPPCTFEEMDPTKIDLACESPKMAELESTVDKLNQEVIFVHKFMDILREAFTMKCCDPLNSLAFVPTSPYFLVARDATLFLEHFHDIKDKLDQLYSLLMNKVENMANPISIEYVPDLDPFEHIDCIRFIGQELFSTVHQLHEEKILADKKVHSLKERLSRLKQRFEARGTSLIDEVSCSQVETEAASLNGEIASLRETISSLTPQLGQHDERERQAREDLKRMASELELQRRENERLTAEVVRLHVDLEDKLNQYEDRNSATEQLESQQCQNNALTAEVDRSSVEKMASLQETISSLQNKLSQYEESDQRTKEAMKQLESELESQRCETERITAEINRLNAEERASLQETISSLQSKLSQYEERDQRTKEAMKQLESELESQRCENERLTAEVNRLNSEVENIVAKTTVDNQESCQQTPQTVDFDNRECNICTSKLSQLEEELKKSHEQSQQLITERNELSIQLVSIQGEWEKLVTGVQAKHKECENYYQQLQQLSSESTTQILSLQAELARVQGSEQQSHNAYQRVLRLLASLLDVEEAVLGKNYSPEAMGNLASNVKKEVQQMKSDIVRYVENEKKLHAELDRLRAHLFEMEENCTREALEAEAREDQLRRQLLATEEANSQFSSMTAAQHEFYVEQIETLKDENSIARDTILKYEENIDTLTREIAVLQEQVNKLQSVLITYETEREALVRSETDRLHREVTQFKEQCNDLEKRNQELRSQISSQQEVSDAARRLTVQMQRAEEETHRLKNLIDQRDVHIHQLLKELQQQKTVLDSKIDKLLAKNLIMGYFHAPANKRGEALRVIGSFLEFSDIDFVKIGVDTSNTPGWFSWVKRDSSLGKIHEEDASYKDSSFSQLFIQFLEHESKPFPSLKLSTDDLLPNAPAHVSHKGSRQRISTSFSSGSTSSIGSSPAHSMPYVSPSADVNPLLRGMCSNASSSQLSHPQNL